MYLASGGTVRNCTVGANSASSQAGGIFSSNGGRVENTIAYFNTAPSGANYANGGSGFSYGFCCATPLMPGTGNRTNDPLLVNAGAGDWHLAPGSPCIDAGTNLTAAGITNDLDGVPRPLDGDNDGTSAFDIGAYEFVHPAADSDRDGMKDIDESVAGTDPLNPASCLRIAALSNLPPCGVLYVLSSTGRTYALQCRTNLMSGAWTNVAAPPIPGNGGGITVTVTNSTAASQFYRISVDRP